jgi:ABC-type branched-subunit amino acid transport system ATPase component
MEVVGVFNKNNNIEQNLSFIKYIFNNNEITCLPKLSNKMIQTEFKKIKNDISLNKIKNSLTLVGIEYLDIRRKSLEISDYEQKKLALALVIITKPNILYLDNIDKGLNQRDKVNLGKFLKKINEKFKIKIAISSNDIVFLTDVTEKNYYIDENDINSFSNYLNLHIKFINKPEIVKFIELSAIYGHDLSKYNDIKEIIKAIYRGE